MICKGSDTMNIAGLSVDYSAASVNGDIGVLMLGKSLDMVDTMGAGMQKILESAADPNVGQNLDISV